MNGSPSRSPARFLLPVLAVVALLGGGAFYLVRTQRVNFVKSTLTILGSAEQAYANGRFPEASESAAGALVRFETHPTWFESAEQAVLRDGQRFLAEQAALWKRVESAAGTIDADPAKARAELEALFAQGLQGGTRAKPLLDRAGSHLKAALDKERAKVEAAIAAGLPDARRAYEQGSWDDLLARAAELKGLIASLPEASRASATRAVEKELKDLEDAAAPVSAMRAIRDGKDEGYVKADRLRELIGKLADLKGRDLPLHRELRRAIAEVDPETRQPVAGLALPRKNYDSLAETFSKDSGLEKTGNPDDLSVIELQGPAHRYAIRIVGRPPQILIEVDRVRLQFTVPLVDDREAVSLKAAADLAAALRASRHPRVFGPEPWIVQANGPDLCAVNVEGTQASVLIGRRIFDGTVDPPIKHDPLIESLRASVAALKMAVQESASVPEEARGPLVAMIGASVGKPNPADHLDGQFCREALFEGYVEAQVPKLDETVASRLKEYRRAYGEVSKLRSRFEAKSADGATATFFFNFDSAAQWRVVDPAANTTTWSMMPRDHMRPQVATASVFPGTHLEFPADVEPLEVRMVHGTMGIVSRWTAANGKLEVDAERWKKAVTLGEIPEHFGSGEWQVPPHALKVDSRGQARELILPAGSLQAGSFATLTAGPERRAAQDKLVQRCSEIFKTPGEFHLFYRYFVQYVLDSPVTTATALIGSSSHCGDAHQDAYQTLDRRLNGKFLADCDDLAELYWTILRRQNRQAFVLGVPGHATCGVAEKTADGWTFFCVDTGPCRQLKGPDLDAIIEKLLRTYDRDGSMAFDPRQMRFLFRFAGEQTRSDYYLDSRILRDAEYADLMIRVQEYWHFGFYALGIETMSRVLESDKMPANCQEIAGLYTRVGLWEESLKWTQEGIRGLDAKDLFTGLNDTMRVVQCLRELKRDADAAAQLTSTAERITKVLSADPAQADRYRSLRFGVAAQLAESGKPWEGWAFVKEEVGALVASGHAAETLMMMVVKVYQEMQEAVRAGRKLEPDQATVMTDIAHLLDRYYESACFESDDSNLDVARKYGQYFGYRIAVQGLDKATAELVKPELPKDAKRPDIRREPQAVLDWPWIRLSPVPYMIAAASALDKDEPGAGGPKVAVEVIRALESALPEIRKQGSLGTMEFQVLDLKLLRGCFEMDEKTIRSVFEEMKRQGWGALYESLSGTLGRAAEHMKVADFEKVFRIYGEYEAPRRHYYGVVYAALAAEARAHALAASKICVEKFPTDADMKREHALLQKLIK